VVAQHDSIGQPRATFATVSTNENSAFDLRDEVQLGVEEPLPALLGATRHVQFVGPALPLESHPSSLTRARLVDGSGDVRRHGPEKFVDSGDGSIAVSGAPNSSRSAGPAPRRARRTVPDRDPAVQVHQWRMPRSSVRS